MSEASNFQKPVSLEGLRRNNNNLNNKFSKEFIAKDKIGDGLSVNEMGLLSVDPDALDDRYYTETEIDDKLVSKANNTHTHSASQISGLPAPTAFSVTVSTWSASSDIEFPFKADITVSGITATDSVDVRFNKASIKLASTAGVITGETTAGKITLLAEKKPEATLSGVYIITKGAS